MLGYFLWIRNAAKVSKLRELEANTPTICWGTQLHLLCRRRPISTYWNPAFLPAGGDAAYMRCRIPPRRTHSAPCWVHGPHTQIQAEPAERLSVGPFSRSVSGYNTWSHRPGHCGQDARSVGGETVRRMVLRWSGLCLRPRTRNQKWALGTQLLTDTSLGLGANFVTFKKTRSTSSALCGPIIWIHLWDNWLQPEQVLLLHSLCFSAVYAKQ